MAASSDIYQGNDEVSGQMLCQPCLNLDKRLTAEIFCSTCNEFQCMDCSKGHYKYTYMRDHKLVTVNEAEKKEVPFDVKALEICIQHQKVIEYICEDHSQLCCRDCAIYSHRKCISIAAIQNVVGKTGSGPSLKETLLEVRQKVEIIIESVVSSIEQLKEDVKKVPVEIRRMREKVFAMFDELEDSIIKQLKSFETETLDKLTKKHSQNEKYLDEVSMYLETIDNVHHHGNSVQQFIVEHNLQKNVNVLHLKVNAECQDLETICVTFDFDETLNLTLLPDINYVPGQLSFKPFLSEAAGTVSPDMTMKLTPVNTVDLKQGVEDIEEPFYTGIDFLPDGRVVAVDNENMKCLVYNEKLEKTGSFQLFYMPLSVVAVSEQEVAVTTDDEYKLDILHVNKSNDINLDRTFPVISEYDSICLKDSGHFVVGTSNHSTPVHMISSTGIEEDFNINLPNKTYPLNTSACTYIKNMDKVVLTDRHDDTVFIYCIKTNTRVVVRDDQMKEPCGVAVGPSDTILVCSKQTNSIIQISQSGRMLSSYKVNMNLPSAICVSHDKTFLVVTNSSVGEKKLQKFKIAPD